MFLCVSGTSKKFGVWGPKSSDIDLSPIPCIFFSWPSFGYQHSTHGCANTYQVVCKCSYVSQEHPKNLVHGVLIEAEILTSAFPHVFSQFSPVCWYCHSSHGSVNMSQMIYKCSYVSQEPQKLVYGPLIEVEKLTCPLHHVFAHLGQVFGCCHSNHRCQHLQSGPEMFLCVSGTSKNIWCM